jgi:hypothetical protein
MYCFLITKLFQVANARAANWAKHKGIKSFFECSASDDQNVTRAFEDIANRAVQRAVVVTKPMYAPVSLAAVEKKGSCAC